MWGHAGRFDLGWGLGYSLVYLGRFDEAQKIPRIEENFVVTALMLVRSGEEVTQQHVTPQSLDPVGYLE